jgi:hypothetical protein
MLDIQAGTADDVAAVDALLDADPDPWWAQQGHRRHGAPREGERWCRTWAGRAGGRAVARRGDIRPELGAPRPVLLRGGGGARSAGAAGPGLVRAAPRRRGVARPARHEAVAIAFADVAEVELDRHDTDPHLAPVAASLPPHRDDPLLVEFG